MVKRASVSAAVSPAKRQSVGEMATSLDGKSPIGQSPVKVFKIPGRLDEVFKVLKASADASTAEMLISTLPLAIKVTEGGEPRHGFQEKMLEAVATVLSNAVASQEEAVSALEKEAASLEKGKGQSAAIDADIATSLAEKKKGCDATEEALKSRQMALKEAQDVLEAAQRSATEADSDLECQKGHLAELEAGLTDLWQPLKASEIPGQKWRQRDVKLSQLVGKFQAIGVDESLLAAIQTALKMKADTRGEFAQATVTFAEEAYTKLINTKREEIDAFGSDISARAAAVTEAEAGVNAAQDAVDAKMQESFDAQNAWAELTNRDVEHKAEMQAYEPMAEALQKKLAAAKVELLHLEGISGSFESERSGVSATAEEGVVAAADIPEPARAETVFFEPEVVSWSTREGA